jgi:glycosyltransferase involved in cell wall biosynthesis
MSDSRTSRSSYQPHISVLLPVRNESQQLMPTLYSIIEGRSHPFPLEIVIVDDASRDCCSNITRDFARNSGCVDINVIRLDTWSGIPYARNVAASAARSGIFFITDANVRFPHGWDIPIRKQLRSNRVLCATIADMASKFRGYGCVLEIPSMGVHWLRSPSVFRGFVPVSPCGGTIITADLFHRTGGYDTGMPAYGAAEPEFSVRLWLGGAEIVSLPDLVLLHRFRPWPERNAFLQRIASLQVHNYIRFGLLYLGERQLLQMLRHYAITAPQHFENALRQVAQGDVWARREFLARTLRFTFGSYVRRFGIRDPMGQLAV